MSDNSKIEWTDATWNPVAGCSIVSPGCHNCYAMKTARRLEAMGQAKYAGTTKDGRWTGLINTDENALDIPLRTRKPRKYFVNSMSDLFHKNVPDDFINRVFEVMERAYQYFVSSWQGRNGTAGTKRVDYQLAVRWTKSGGSTAVRWRHAWESIPAWHQRLANVVILRRDAFSILDRFEDVAGTAIYADPPYFMDSRTGFRAGKGSSNKYLHEFDHDNPMFGDDHKRLRDVLAGYKRARVVVSYYDCPRIRAIYKGWTFIKHTMQKRLHAQNGRGAPPKEAPEVLILNGPSYAERNQ